MKELNSLGFILTMINESDIASFGAFLIKMFDYIKPGIIFIIGYTIVVLFVFKRPKEYRSLNVNYFFKKENSRINKNEINNFRYIPCNNDLFRANTIANIYSLNKKGNEANIVGAILLKWILNNEVSIVNLSDKNLKKIGIDLRNELQTSNESELELYEILKEASKGGILEDKELQKWCKKNPNKLFKWLKILNLRESEKLVNENMLVKNIEQFNRNSYYVNAELKEEGIQLIGLKKFLEEFSQIKEKQPIEVKLWKEYLIYAQIFGIADKVAKQFKELYPEIREIDEYNLEGEFINRFVLIEPVTFRRTNYTGSSRSKSAKSYLSGGGGFSSFGGGRGSHGGGSGGGCR